MTVQKMGQLTGPEIASDNLPKLLDFPERISIEFTNCCNLKCSMCPRHLMKGKQGYMEFDLYKKIIDEISQHKPLALVPFFRGESMLHPDFIRMLEYAKKAGITPIQIASNATRLTKEIATALVDLEIDFISFSIDSINPATYANIRVNGKLDQVLKNIEYFCEYRLQKKSKLPEVQVSIVRTETNQDEIDEFVKYWRNKVDRVRLFEQHTADGNFGSVGALKDRFQFPRRLPCHKVFREMNVYWNGQVALCCHDWDRTEMIGDLNTHTVAEIWKGQRYTGIQATHLTDLDNMEELCKNCDQWKAYYLPQLQGTLGETYFPDEI